jgi:hypothetical protein
VTVEISSAFFISQISPPEIVFSKETRGPPRESAINTSRHFFALDGSEGEQIEIGVNLVNMKVTTA